ncbi:hypothetical protein Cgig2_013270 [Carnegiea gigantea]|uniref:Uncharacterized protein n=1 Tax=Carnegiea gigantea TaxID=171969 RepID=A0A9Q1K377_9CARY|nr:hypothetical protein Cgig2_013270 [Carnegiea gigantea]
MTPRTSDYKLTFVIAIMVDSPYKFVSNALNLEFVIISMSKVACKMILFLATVIRMHVDLQQTGVYRDECIICSEHVHNLFEGLAANVKFLTLSNDIVQFPILLLVLGLIFARKGLVRDVYELYKTPPRPMPKYLMSWPKDVWIEELYVGVTLVESLVEDVIVLKRQNLRLPFKSDTTLHMPDVCAMSHFSKFGEARDRSKYSYNHIPQEAMRHRECAFSVPYPPPSILCLLLLGCPHEIWFPGMLSYQF